MSFAFSSLAEEAGQVRDLVYRSVEALDGGDWDAWLELCLPSFEYAIVAYSPELRRDMVWLQHDRAGLHALVAQLSAQEVDGASFTRHASVYRASPRAGGSWDALTSVTIYRTERDGGATSLFAVGKYADVVSFEGSHAGFTRRTLRLETRELGLGTPFPL